MKLIIDIPEEVYRASRIIDVKYEDVIQIPLEVIKNGTPLPKGHGRLIDADRFDVISYQHISDNFDNGVIWLAEQIDNAPTIIEADKESEG